MATLESCSSYLRCIATILLLALNIHHAACSRSLTEEEDTPIPTVVSPPLPVSSAAAATTPLTVVSPPLPVSSAAAATTPLTVVSPPLPVSSAAAATTPLPVVSPPLPVSSAAAATTPLPAAAATTAATPLPAAAAAAATTPNSAAASAPEVHPLTFYMHDILGGSNPSATAVTGIVANPALSAQVPFAKPNGANLPINSGVPQNSGNNGLINNNNVPFLTGLSGTTGNVMQNNGMNLINGGGGFPVLNGGQLPQGMTIQKMMFGTLTVFDDELTEGHELGSGMVGKAQGFYIASSEDGNSQTMALTAMFERGGYADSISLFGVHRTIVSESQLAIMGGTGMYVNARGYATIKTFPASSIEHNTDGVETILEFTVYLA